MKQFFETNIAVFISNLLSLAANIVIARKLGPVLKGEYSSVFALFETVIYLTILGIPSSIIYSAARNHERAKKVSFLIFIFTLLSGLVASSVFLAVYLSDSFITRNISKNYVGLILPLSFFSIALLYFSSLLLARRLIRERNLTNVAYSFFFLIFVLLLLLTNRFNIFWLIIANYFSFALVLFYLIYTVIKKVGIKPGFDTLLFREMASVGLRAYMVNLMSYIMIRSDILMLNFLKNNYHVGIYTVASGLALKLFIIPDISSSLLKPIVTENLSKNIELQLKVSRLISLLMLSVLLISGLLYYPLVKIVYGKAYLPSYEPFLLLIPGIYFLSATNQLTPYYTAKGYPFVTIFSTFTSTLVNVLLNLLLIPRLGYNAAAITSTIAYTLLFGMYFADFKKQEGKRLRDVLLPSKSEIREVFSMLAAKIKGRFYKK